MNVYALVYLSLVKCILLITDGVTPGPLLTGALKFLDAKLGQFQAAIALSADPNTVIVLTAK